MLRPKILSVAISAAYAKFPGPPTLEEHLAILLHVQASMAMLENELILGQSIPGNFDKCFLTRKSLIELKERVSLCKLPSNCQFYHPSPNAFVMAQGALNVKSVLNVVDS